MIYPKFLTKNSVIGITALSAGCMDTKEEMNDALRNLKQFFSVIWTPNVFGNYIVSSNKDVRLKELNSLLEQNIDLLQIARGGDFLYEILDKIPCELIVKKRLLVQGYSDVTSLLYILTTKYDLSTIYGLNGKSYAYKLDKYQLNNLKILTGDLICQNNYDSDFVSVNGNFEREGMLIGGCLEVLKNIIGTKFDATKEFLAKYRDSSIIWYFDIYNMNPIDVYLTFLQFKDAGWFEYSDTFIIGKVLFKQKEDVITYQEAYTRALFGNILYDANIGHTKPMFTLINGSMAHITCTENCWKLQQKFQNMTK